MRDTGNEGWVGQASKASDGFPPSFIVVSLLISIS